MDILSLIVIAVIVLAIIISSVSGHYSGKIDDLTKENDELRRTNNKLEFRNIELDNRNNELYFKLREEKQKSKSAQYNKDVLEAVRKAMIYSHPDKGNCSNADDFIKYKKIYDEIKRG